MTGGSGGLHNQPPHNAGIRGPPPPNLGMQGPVPNPRVYTVTTTTTTTTYHAGPQGPMQVEEVTRVATQPGPASVAARVPPQQPSSMPMGNSTVGMMPMVALPLPPPPRPGSRTSSRTSEPILPSPNANSRTLNNLPPPVIVGGDDGGDNVSVVTMQTLDYRAPGEWEDGARQQQHAPPGLEVKELKEEAVAKLAEEKAWMCMKCFVSVGGNICQGCGGEEPDFMGIVDGIIGDLE